MHSGNMLVDPPENFWSLPDIRSKWIENHKGDSGKSFEEAKSGDHVSQDRYLSAETDLESSSRFEDGKHKNGPADPSSTVQTSFQQTLNADAIRLENSSDPHNENELPSPEVTLLGGLSHTRMINTYESERRELCNHVIKVSNLL